MFIFISLLLTLLLRLSPVFKKACRYLLENCTGRFFFIILVLFLSGITALLFFDNEGSPIAQALLPKNGNIVYTPLNEYGNFDDFSDISSLSIFPDKLPRHEESIRYYCNRQNTWFHSAAQIYLACSYSRDEYKAELERLTNLSREHNGKARRSRYNVSLFEYPAFITILASDHCYEYALLLGNDQIAYIFLQNTKAKNVPFDRSYLPVNYEKFSEDFQYSIYSDSDEKNVAKTTILQTLSHAF